MLAARRMLVDRARHATHWTKAFQGVFAIDGWAFYSDPSYTPPDPTVDYGDTPLTFFLVLNDPFDGYVDIIIVGHAADGSAVEEVAAENVHEIGGRGGGTSVTGPPPAGTTWAEIRWVDHTDPTIVYFRWTYETYVP